MLLADEHAPERGIPFSQYEARRAVGLFHLRAQALGSILILKRAGLDGVPIFRRHDWLEREDVEANLGDAGSDDLDFLRGCVRKIDDASGDEGTAVDDADVDRFSVGEIGDAHHGSEGKGAVRGGEFLHVVNFAVGGGASVIRMSVPARESGFAGADGCGNGRRARCCDAVVFFSTRGKHDECEGKRQRGKSGASGHLVRS